MNDPLSELLRVAGVRGSLISRATLGDAFGVAAPPQARAIFHVPVKGHGWVRAGDQVVEIGPGDVAVLPKGAAHVVSDTADRRPVPIGRYPRAVADGGLPLLHNDVDDIELDLLCGTFALGSPAARWVTEAMPELLVVRGSDATRSYLDATVALLAGEVAWGGPGAAIVSDRLVEVLVVHIVRGWATQSGADHPGWVAGIQDPHIGRVIGAVHQRPSQPWTLPSMAKVAGLSRTRFVKRFTDRVGVPPGAWLTEWRMAVAQRALSDGAAVAEAAAAVGYASEASFTRAFKRVAGTTPTAWRGRERAFA